jgi:hypothetical protein
MTLNLQTPFPTLVEVLVAGYAQLKKKKCDHLDKSKRANI